jgi:hypothetical protein
MPGCCVACGHASHRGGECGECVCTYLPAFEWNHIERQWTLFRYREGSMWRVAGREGRFEMIRADEGHALLARRGEGDQFEVAQVDPLDLLPFEEE